MATNKPPVDGENSVEAEEWCWREPCSEIAYGPFASREEAIEEARGSTDAAVVMIGHCVHPDPVYTAGQVADIDDFLERMDEYVCDNSCFFHNDEIFEMKNTEEAKEAFKAALVDWAREHLKSCIWHTGEEEEEEIEPKTDEE